ncbi:MAG: hypothetical protein M3Y42_00320 [Actinomycetota bacterium]|nr:hypothetical protein [Actinomycetota bacterium]MDQ2955399.1 hypothetical protein [Actinomycetota bacterium]
MADIAAIEGLSQTAQVGLMSPAYAWLLASAAVLYAGLFFAVWCVRGVPHPGKELNSGTFFGLQLSVPFTVVSVWAASAGMPTIPHVIATGLTTTYFGIATWCLALRGPSLIDEMIMTPSGHITVADAAYNRAARAHQEHRHGRHGIGRQKAHAAWHAAMLRRRNARHSPRIQQFNQRASDWLMPWANADAWANTATATVTIITLLAVSGPPTAVGRILVLLPGPAYAITCRLRERRHAGA